MLFPLCLRCLLLVPRPRAAPVQDCRKQHVRDPEHGGETVVAVVLKSGGPAGSPSLRPRAHPAFATSLPLLSLSRRLSWPRLFRSILHRDKAVHFRGCPSTPPPGDSVFSSYIPSYPNPVPFRAAPLNSDSSWLTPIVPLDLPHGDAPLVTLSSNPASRCPRSPAKRVLSHVFIPLPSHAFVVIPSRWRPPLQMSPRQCTYPSTPKLQRSMHRSCMAPAIYDW